MDCKNAIEDNTDDKRDTLKQADTCESLACKNNFQIKFASLPHAMLLAHSDQSNAAGTRTFIRLMNYYTQKKNQIYRKCGKVRGISL